MLEMCKATIKQQATNSHFAYFTGLQMLSGIKTSG